jgi:SAM-dependent methyltransferase
MPLNSKQRLALRNKLHPTADARLFAPINAALRQFMRPGAAVLDAGAGPGTWILDRYTRQLRLTVGADVGFPAEYLAPTNAQMRKELPVLADLARLPFVAASFDAVVCYNVIEHLPDPPAVFREYARLLVPGGALLFKTPCLTNPTIVASHLLPFSWHQSIKRRLTSSAEDDIFPTYYRCNTPDSLERALRDAGLQRQNLITVDQTYDYLHFSGLTYSLGLLFSRLTTMPGLGWLGNAIIGVYTRPIVSPDPALTAPSAEKY